MKKFILILLISIFSNTKPLLIDDAKILSTREKKELKRDLKTIEKGDKYRLYVYTVTGGDTLINYRHRETFLNNIKQEYQPNSVLIYVAINDRKMHIRTGRYIMHYLTDSMCLYTIDQMKPEFKEARYFEGLQKGVNTIDSIVSHSGL